MDDRSARLSRALHVRLMGESHHFAAQPPRQPARADSNLPPSPSRGSPRGHTVPVSSPPAALAAPLGSFLACCAPALPASCSVTPPHPPSRRRSATAPEMPARASRAYRACGYAAGSVWGWRHTLLPSHFDAICLVCMQLSL
jgi:hypothetical protein